MKKAKTMVDTRDIWTKDTATRICTWLREMASSGKWPDGSSMERVVVRHTVGRCATEIEQAYFGKSPDVDKTD